MAEEFRQLLLESDGAVGGEQPDAVALDEDALLADAAVDVARQLREVALRVEDEGAGGTVLLAAADGDSELACVRLQWRS